MRSSKAFKFRCWWFGSCSLSSRFRTSQGGHRVHPLFDDRANIGHDDLLQVVLHPAAREHALAADQLSSATPVATPVIITMIVTNSSYPPSLGAPSRACRHTQQQIGFSPATRNTRSQV